MIHLEQRTVFVLGAGFTKAFLPDAPLLVGDFRGKELLEKFSGFPHAANVLRSELDLAPEGLIDLERLMTRLDSKMPYDAERGASQELDLMLSDVKRTFVKVLEEARRGEFFQEELGSFARVCVERGIDCITFNYDDVFDEALWKVRSAVGVPDGAYWHPDGGYGFFCLASELSVRQSSLGVQMDNTSMLLLKLHGSVNWRAKMGYPQPYSADALMHHEDWLPPEHSSFWNKRTIEMHLERDPFLVPPVLTKESLVREPILRLIWSRALEVLSSADLVVFVGYSLPVTDIASGFLFREAVGSSCKVRVVNLAESKQARANLLAAYRRVFASLRWDNLSFAGALEWVREFNARYQAAS